jgi:hypothetical protein
MILGIAFVLGFAFGWLRATRRAGNLLDKLQYGAVHAIIFVLVALVLTMALDWAGLV